MKAFLSDSLNLLLKILMNHGQTIKRKILDHLKKLSGHIILIMTHRLSILPQLDQVVFIDDHKVQVDTHDALMAKNVHYVKLIEGGKDHA